jgi:hypothetical protein
MKKYLFFLISVGIILVISTITIITIFFNIKLDHYSITGEMQAEDIAKEAILKNDPSICDKITLSRFSLGGPDEESLKYTCYRIIAVALKMPDICNKNMYQESKSLCYEYYAIETKDESFCKKTSGSSSTVCFSNLAQLKNNINICEMPEISYDRDFCYFKFADFKNDKSICDEINDEKLKKDCRAYNN